MAPNRRGNPSASSRGSPRRVADYLESPRRRSRGIVGRFGQLRASCRSLGCTFGPLRPRVPTTSFCGESRASVWLSQRLSRVLSLKTVTPFIIRQSFAEGYIFCSLVVAPAGHLRSELALFGPRFGTVPDPASWQTDPRRGAMSHRLGPVWDQQAWVRLGFRMAQPGTAFGVTHLGAARRSRNQERCIRRVKLRRPDPVTAKNGRLGAVAAGGVVCQRSGAWHLACTLHTPSP